MEGHWVEVVGARGEIHRLWVPASRKKVSKRKLCTRRHKQWQREAERGDMKVTDWFAPRGKRHP